MNQFDLKEPSNKDNIVEIVLPYYWLNKNDNGARKRNLIVFFGSDFFNMEDEINLTEFIRIENECLEFIRINYADCRLIYKPHPAERNESSMLNLDGYEIREQNTIAEIFLPDKFKNIKAVFAMVSTASTFAHEIGLDSYIFLKIIEKCFDETSRKAYSDFYFRDMPDNFFITDLSRAPLPNAIKPQKNLFLEESVCDIVEQNGGDVWFSVCETKFIPHIIALTNMIHENYPSKKINIVISKQSRWENIDRSFLSEYFEKIYEFPRCFYSINPRKIWTALKVASKVRRLQLAPGDMIFGFAPHDFVENCLISYHKKNFAAVFVQDVVFSLHYRATNSPFLAGKKLRFDKASYFFNKILEPILSLYPSLFLRYDFGPDHYISRPEGPINEIYQKVFLLK